MPKRCPTCGTNSETETYRRHGCITCKAREHRQISPRKQKQQEIDEPLTLNLNLTDQEQYLKERQIVIQKEPASREHSPKEEVPFIKTIGLRQALGLIKSIGNR